MKLIDILVQELPKRGGWPEGAEIISMHADGVVYINKKRTFDLPLPQCTDGWDRNKHTPNYTNEVTREQYETALKQSVWDGTGLPPVGVECEWQDKNTKKWVGVLVVYASEWVTVIRENKPVDPVELAIENYGDEARRKFRPIRSEAERKRDESIEAIHNNLMRVKYKAEEIYNAIAEGKIPGIKLEK